MHKIILMLLSAVISSSVIAENSVSVGNDTKVSKAIPKAELAKLSEKAKAGDAEAQYSLGMIYFNGVGVSKDFEIALDWFKQSAEQGNVEALYKLGEVYLVGFGVNQDINQAILCFRKAYEYGSVGALFQLANIYDSGQFVTRNPEEAAKWYELAANKGKAWAQARLGEMYRQGDGVPKMLSNAIYWNNKAVAQGDSDGQFNLGRMYSKGEGVPKSETIAFSWFQKAASQGPTLAQRIVGLSYELGEGVSKDKIRAYAWMNLAASKDDEDATKLRDDFEKLLTPDQRAEGQRLAANWKKGDVFEGVAAKDSSLSKVATGTAFIISNNLHAITNHHVIDGCTEVKVAGREGLVKVITSDSVNDLALLQLPGKTKDVVYLNPEPGKLRQGEDIIVFGYPLDYLLSSGGNLTPGIISALSGLGNNTNQIQITAPIQPGSSGSPVLDNKGSVVGVVSMKLDDGKMAQATGSVPQNVNFAINGQTLKTFLDTNKVPYKMRSKSAKEKHSADIAEDARKWTVLVECWK